MGNDPYDLQRFIDAQASIYDQAAVELRMGRKRTHWMWFVFPQLRGLGFSATATRYGIASIDEARAYLAHPVLGARLLECTRWVLAVTDRTAHEIFGSPDDQKFRSSMTLFAHAGPEAPEFRAALARYYAGEEDPLTVARL